MSEQIHQLSLRIPEQLHQQIKAIAQERKSAVGALINSLLQQEIDRIREDQLIAAFDNYALADLDETSVDFAQKAQTEVVMRDE